MSDPRNHHYVPQAYLRGFADARGQVCVRWRLRTGTPFITSVRNVASERDFYTFVNDKTGVVDYASLEQGLNLSESVLRASLREYIGGGPTDRDTLKARIAVCVGLQMTRTKYFRRKLERIADVGARTWIEAKHPDLTKLLDSVHFRPGSDVHLKILGDWAVTLGGVLLDRSWFIVRATEGQFITNDNPVYGVAGHTDALDVGVLAASEIRYPIDASSAMVWTPQSGHDAAILLTAREVRDFNAATFANAFEQAYARPNYKSELESIPRHRDTLIDRINAMSDRPEFTAPGTRRFDPSSARV